MRGSQRAIEIPEDFRRARASPDSSRDHLAVAPHSRGAQIDVGVQPCAPPAALDDKTKGREEPAQSAEVDQLGGREIDRDVPVQTERRDDEALRNRRERRNDDDGHGAWIGPDGRCTESDAAIGEVERTAPPDPTLQFDLYSELACNRNAAQPTLDVVGGDGRGTAALCEGPLGVTIGRNQPRPPGKGRHRREQVCPRRNVADLCAADVEGEERIVERMRKQQVAAGHLRDD
jgi:hypothetical protein